MRWRPRPTPTHDSVFRAHQTGWDRRPGRIRKPEREAQDDRTAPGRKHFRLYQQQLLPLYRRGEKGGGLCAQPQDRRPVHVHLGAGGGVRGGGGHRVPVLPPAQAEGLQRLQADAGQGHRPGAGHHPHPGDGGAGGGHRSRGQHLRPVPQALHRPHHRHRPEHGPDPGRHHHPGRGSCSGTPTRCTAWARAVP